MHPLKIVTASLMLAAMPILAHAEDMSYRYIQLGYMQANLDTDGIVAAGDETGDGFASRGSIGFANNFFVFTELSKQAFDFDVDLGEGGIVPVDIDVDQITLGLGGHFPISDNVDLVGRAGWSQLKFDVDVGTESDDGDETGYLVGGGLRGRIGESFELEGGVIYQDFGNGADDTGGELLARWHFNKRWALAAEYQDLGDVSSYIIGVRASF